MKRRERLGPRSRAPMSELPGPRPLHTHIPQLCDPGPRPLEKCPGAGGGGLRSAAPHRVGEDGGGAGAGEAQGGRGGGKRRPGRWGDGERQTPRRGTRAAGGGSKRRPGGGRWRPGRPGGNPKSSMKSPRGRGSGAVLGRLSGDPRHPWLGGGRGGALGVSRAWGPAARGGGWSWVG